MYVGPFWLQQVLIRPRNLAGDHWLGGGLLSLVNISFTVPQWVFYRGPGSPGGHTLQYQFYPPSPPIIWYSSNWNMLNNMALFALRLGVKSSSRPCPISISAIKFALIATCCYQLTTGWGSPRPALLYNRLLLGWLGRTVLSPKICTPALNFFLFHQIILIWDESCCWPSDRGPGCYDISTSKSNQNSLETLCAETSWSRDELDANCQGCYRNW